MVEHEERTAPNGFHLYETHRRFMQQAHQLARQAYAEDEVPVGCVIVHDGCIVGRGYNRTQGFSDSTAHAEIIALTAAFDTLKRKTLEGCTVYVTLEPCAMCAGALLLARIDQLVFGAWEPKTGCCGSLYNLVDDSRFNHRIPVLSGILEQECADLLSTFFKNKR